MDGNIEKVKYKAITIGQDDMSYMCIMLMVFVLLGILSTIIIPENNKKKTKNIINILIIIGLILILGINGLNQLIYSKMLYVENENNVDIAYEKLQDINQYPTYLLSVKQQNINITQMYAKAHNIDENAEIIKNLEFMLKYEKYNNVLENCQQLIETYSAIDNITEEEYIEKVEEICNIAKDTKISEIYSTSKNFKGQVTYLEIAEILREQYEKWQNETLKKFSNEMCRIVINEYDEVLERISDYERCRITKESSEEMIEIVKENYEKAKSMVE